MVDGKHCEPFKKTPVKIQHPLNEEMNHLRNSLLISLLGVADKNIRRRRENINIFEVGKSFEKLENDEIRETNTIAALLCGKLSSQKWNAPEVEYDFYDIKGIAEEFLAMRKYSNFTFENREIPSYFDKEESLSIFCLGDYIGTFGRVDDSVLKTFDIDVAVYCLEMPLENIKVLDLKNSMKLSAISKYPEVVKDVSILMDENMEASEAEVVIRKSAGKKLKKVEVIDLYKGKQLEEGKKSYSFRMTLGSDSGTLKEKEIEKIFNKVITQLTKNLNVKLR